LCRRSALGHRRRRAPCDVAVLPPLYRAGGGPRPGAAARPIPGARGGGGAAPRGGGACRHVRRGRTGRWAGAARITHQLQRKPGTTIMITQRINYAAQASLGIAFDEEWYLREYRDVAEPVRSGRLAAALQHYLL